MKWSLLVLLLSYAPASAASIGWALPVPPPGHATIGGGYTLTSEASLTMSDTSDLTPGLPIELTFYPRMHLASAELRCRGGGFFRDVITASAMIGGQTVSVSTLYEVAIPGSTQIFLYPDFTAFSVTVPWDADPALSMTVSHSAFLSGERAQIVNIQAETDFIITTRSIPEPSAAAVVAAGLLLSTASRRRSRPSR